MVARQYDVQPVPGVSNADKYKHVWMELLKVCVRHLEDGSRKLQLAKQASCYLQLLDDAAARRYYAALLRVYCGTLLLSAAARHYLGGAGGRELLTLTTKAELTWDAAGGALKNAACRASEACGQGGGSGLEALRAGIREALEILQDEQEHEGEVVVRWQPGACAVCLLPLEPLDTQLPVTTWIHDRECLAFLANMWMNEVQCWAPDMP